MSIIPFSAQRNGRDSRSANMRECLALHASTVGQLAHFLPPIRTTDRCKSALARFLGDRSLFALPVVDASNIPVALVERKQYIEFFGRLYALDIYGSRSIIELLGMDEFESGDAIMVEHDRAAMEVAQIILDSSGQGIGSGFLITDQGRYLGIGNANELLRMITERNVSALRESEERFRTLVAASAEVVWNVDAGGEGIGDNLSWRNFTGQSCAEITGGSWGKAVHPQDRAKVEGIVSRAVANRVTYEVNVRMRRFDGEWRHMRVRGAPVFGAQGSVREWVGYCQDITESIDAEASRAQLGAIVENSNDAIYSRSLDGRILTWNAGAEKMLGYSAAEAIGQASHFVLVGGRKSRLKEINESVLRGEKTTRESERRTKDGQVIPVLSSHSPIKDSAGNIVGVSTILQDISERKRLEHMRDMSERRLRESEAFNVSVLNSLSEQVAVLEQNGVIMAVNSAWREFARENGASETVVNPVGVNYLDVCQPAAGAPLGEEASAAWSGIIGVLGGERREYILDYPCHSPREQRWFRLWVTPLQGSWPGVVICHENITPRKRAEERQASLEAQLRESQKMQAVGTLAGGIAHDFNNIIATVLGNAELVRQDVPDNAQAQESLEEITKAARRGRELVRQILSFSRRQPAVRKPITLNPIVEEAGRLLRATLPARLSLNIQCASDVPAVLADATQIQQVIINLATNAMQAIGSQPGRIDICLYSVMLDQAMAEAHSGLRAMCAVRPGRAVRVRVSDTGPGIDKAVLARIFEPFFTTKAVDEGTGLGLAVVHGIVEGHEGVIEAKSEPGQGASFVIYFPVAQSAADETCPEEGKASEVRGSGERILYLDDDESMVSLVKRLLERRGYSVCSYVDQAAALAALRANAHAFRLVVTDYNMPGMSGLDIAREVRAIRADLPVAVASGFIDEDLQCQAGAAGVRELIFKADAVEDFCDVVQRLVMASPRGTLAREAAK